MTILKVFGDTRDVGEYLVGLGLWYVARFRCWCRLCSLDEAREIVEDLSTALPERFGMDEVIVLVAEEPGRVCVTIQLEG